MKSKNSFSSLARHAVAEKLKRSLWFALASSGAFLALFAPLLVSASIFSIPALLSSFTKETSAAESDYNSQTVPLLAPAVNIDPMLSIGGGDITLVGGMALLSENGPSGTAADIETALPEATAISVYTVHSGDTLGGIANMFSVSVNTIKGVNNLSGGTIHEGDTLIILPITGVRHTVVKGDTLVSIAEKYKADAAEIAQYNDLDSATPLALGTTLVVPDGELVVPAPVRSPVAKNTLQRAGGTTLTASSY